MIRLATEHPTHPLASELRFTRIRGADRLRDIAREHPASLSAAALARIHPYIDDCCATVRLSLVTALFYAGSVESASWLEQLISHEHDATLLDRSPMVLNTARVAWGRCITQGDYFFPSVSQRILVISRNLDLISALQEVTDRVGAHLYQSHCATDLIGVSAQAQIVDRRCCDPADWEGFLDCLATFGEDDGVDATPLLLIDQTLSAPTSFAEVRLCKPPETVYFINEWCTEDIVRLVEKTLHGTLEQHGASR